MKVEDFVTKWHWAIEALRLQEPNVQYAIWCLLYVDQQGNSPHFTREQLTEFCSDYVNRLWEGTGSIVRQNGSFDYQFPVNRPPETLRRAMYVLYDVLKVQNPIVAIVEMARSGKLFSDPE